MSLTSSHRGGARSVLEGSPRSRERVDANFSELSARVVEEIAFAAYCLCVTSTSAVLTKKWGSHDHR
jgi:hypothetical protein